MLSCSQRDVKNPGPMKWAKSGGGVVVAKRKTQGDKEGWYHGKRRNVGDDRRLKMRSPWVRSLPSPSLRSSES